MKNNRTSNFQKKQIRINKFLLTAIGILIGTSLFAQSNSGIEVNNSSSVFGNPIFIALLSVIVLLLILIVALGKVLTATASNSIRKKINEKGLGILALVTFLALSKTTQAQEIISSSKGIPELNSGILYWMLLIIGFEILVVIILLNSIQSFAKTKAVTIVKHKPSLFELLNATVPIEKEKDILLDHNYDGIHELDNDLPPWWKYGFYLSIVIAIIYLGYYHFTPSGELQIAEYNRSILAAGAEKAEFEKNNLNNVNESNATLLTDKAEIANGEAIFKQNCFACHGKFGEGGVGPNLTDDFWLHGGSIKDIFTSIKYGIPDKGMKSWQADLSAIQINQITSYIKTIHGSMPANGKAAQGDMFVELTIQKDSVKKDSIQ
ncbi:MAG: cbb3-type cytochrome c oxidase N-terminal domain-containing protein [Bacteroidota bacterium]